MAPDVLYQVTATGRVTWLSDAWIQLFSLEKEHFIETYEDFFGVDAERDEAATRLRYLEVCTESGSLLLFELAERWTEIEGEKMYVGAARDVTLRALAERASQTEQKLQALGRLARGLSHELNDFLTVITGEADMLVDGPASEEAKTILETAERAADLTRRLSLFGGHPSAQAATVRLSDLVRDSVRILGRMLEETVQLELDLAAQGTVRAPPSELNAVLATLVSNASDSLPGPGTIRVSTVDLPETSEFAAQKRGVKVPSVALCVEDDGEGVPEAVRLHLFDPFYATGSRGHREGLGLSAVYGIIKRLGGTIRVYSQPKVGTRFDVVLPLARTQAEAPVDSVVEARGGGEFILVVEDDPRVRSMTTRLLERSGFVVLSSGSPSDVAALSDEVIRRVDLMVSDVVMPKMSGPELFDHLRRRRPDLKAIFVTGYAAGLVNNEVFEGTTFLRKPWKRADLLAAIDKCLHSG